MLVSATFFSGPLLTSTETLIISLRYLISSNSKKKQGEGRTGKKSYNEIIS